MEVPFDVSHAGQLRLIKQSLCGNCSEFIWGGQYTHFITFCQKAQWNVCGTLFLCMSPSMEFLITNVATRSVLMSFVKDNYGLGGMARERMKSWLCVVWVDVALWPLLLSIPCVWPALFVSKRIQASVPSLTLCLRQNGLLQHLCPFHISSQLHPNVPGWSMAQSAAISQGLALFGRHHTLPIFSWAVTREDKDVYPSFLFFASHLFTICCCTILDRVA